MKENIELSIINGVIKNIFDTVNSQIYEIETIDGIIKIRVLNYSVVASFLSNELATSKELKIGKEINLIKDDKEYLAIESKNGFVVVLKDKVSPDTDYVRFFGNIEYIEERYGLGESDLLSLIREQRLSKKLVEKC